VLALTIVLIYVVYLGANYNQQQLNHIPMLARHQSALYEKLGSEREHQDELRVTTEVIQGMMFNIREADEPIKIGGIELSVRFLNTLASVLIAGLATGISKIIITAADANKLA